MVYNIFVFCTRTLSITHALNMNIMILCFVDLSRRELSYAGACRLGLLVLSRLGLLVFGLVLCRLGMLVL